MASSEHISVRPTPALSLSSVPRRPAVSVIIPMRDRAWCIERALRSVVTSGCEDVEIVVIDDGSRDGSQEVVRSFAAAHPDWIIRLEAHADGDHKGVGASRNLGAALASAEFLTFLDSDDMVLPGRFDYACRVLRDDAKVDGVYEASETVTHEGRVIPKPLGASLMFRLADGARSYPQFILPTGALVVRRTLFDHVGGFEERKLVGEDINLLFRMAVAGRLVPGRPEVPVIRIYKHDRNVSVVDPWRVHLRELASVWRWARCHPTPEVGRQWLHQAFMGRVFHYLAEFRRTRRSRCDGARLVVYSVRYMPGLVLNPRFWYATLRMFLLGGSHKDVPCGTGRSS